MQTIVSFQDAVNNWSGNFVIDVHLFTLRPKNCVKCERLWRFRLVAAGTRVNIDCTTHFVDLTINNMKDKTKMQVTHFKQAKHILINLLSVLNMVNHLNPKLVR